MNKIQLSLLTAFVLVSLPHAHAGDELTYPLICNLVDATGATVPNVLGTTHTLVVTSAPPSRQIQVQIQSSAAATVTVPGPAALLAGYWDDTSGVKLLTYDPTILDTSGVPTGAINFKLKVTFHAGTPNTYTGSVNFGFGPASAPTDFDTGAVSCKCAQADTHFQPQLLNGQYVTLPCPDVAAKPDHT